MNRSPLQCPCAAPRRARGGLALAFSLVATSTISATTAAWADEAGPSVRFSGFGTVGVAHSSEKNADFISVGDQPSGTGHTRRWDFNPDTKLAGQVDLAWGGQFSASAQLMTRYRYDGSHTPELMMAFAKWRATPALALRAGRLPVPIFLVSDSRTVGFSQAQLRPPVDMYAANLYHYDGADLTWTTDLGGVALKSQAYAGRTRNRLPGGAVLSLSPLAGANVTAESGDWTLRASHLGGTASVMAPALMALLQNVRDGFPAGSLGPGSPAIPGDPALAERYGFTDKRVSYTSFGLSHDPGRWFVTGEVGRVSALGTSASQTLAYVSGGARLGSFTPYATASAVRPRINGAATGHPVVDSMRESSMSLGQKTLSLGCRWDAVKNLALKAQLDRVRPDAGASGQLINLQDAYRPGTAYTVVSAALDFVF